MTSRWSARLGGDKPVATRVMSF